MPGNYLIKALPTLFSLLAVMPGEAQKIPLDTSQKCLVLDRTIYHWAFPVRLFPNAYSIYFGKDQQALRAELSLYSDRILIDDSASVNRMNAMRFGIYYIPPDSLDYFIDQGACIRGCYFESDKGSGILTPVILFRYKGTHWNRDAFEENHNVYNLMDGATRNCFQYNDPYILTDREKNNSTFYPQGYRLYVYDGQRISEKMLELTRDTTVEYVENAIEDFTGKRETVERYAYDPEYVFKSYDRVISGSTFRFREIECLYDKFLTIDFISAHDTVEIFRQLLFHYDGFEMIYDVNVAEYKLAGNQLVVDTSYYHYDPFSGEAAYRTFGTQTFIIQKKGAVVRMSYGPLTDSPARDRLRDRVNTAGYETLDNEKKKK